MGESEGVLLREVAAHKWWKEREQMVGAVFCINQFIIRKYNSDKDLFTTCQFIDNQWNQSLIYSYSTAEFLNTVQLISLFL